jgi:hypothetical protein
LLSCSVLRLHSWSCWQLGQGVRMLAQQLQRCVLYQPLPWRQCHMLACIHTLWRPDSSHTPAQPPTCHSTGCSLLTHPAGTRTGCSTRPQLRPPQLLLLAPLPALPPLPAPPRTHLLSGQHPPPQGRQAPGGAEGHQGDLISKAAAAAVFGMVGVAVGPPPHPCLDLHP